MDLWHGDEEMVGVEEKSEVSRRMLLVASCCIIKPGELFLTPLCVLQILSVGAFSCCICMNLLHSLLPCNNVSNAWTSDSSSILVHIIL